MTDSDLLRKFIKDCLNPFLTNIDICEKWSMTPGLYEAIKENHQMFSILGLLIAERRHGVLQGAKRFESVIRDTYIFPSNSVQH
jgi:hypothetical protein